MKAGYVSFGTMFYEPANLKMISARGNIRDTSIRNTEIFLCCGKVLTSCTGVIHNN